MRYLFFLPALLSLVIGLSDGIADTKLKQEPKKNQPAPPEEVRDDLSGIYHATWIEGDKTSYGVCIVTQESPTVLVFNWSFGASSTIGLGVRKGNYCAVNWIANGKLRGVTLHKIMDGGKRFDGVWMPIPADDAERTEVLRYLRPVKEKEL